MLARGAAIGDSIAQGTACVIRSAADIENFRDGAILVTEMTDPDWVPIMKRAAGIVTDHGGPTSHAAIVSRELGVPAVVGTGNATTVLAEGLAVTISCAEGDEGRVYRGSLAFETEEVDLGELPETHTKVMVNIASPAAAFQWWRLPADGVGLARMEFIISSLIRVHPMALVHPERVTDPGEAEQIRALTSGYADPKDYFVDALARGIAKIAAPYHPRPVIVRLSDFKTNEYAHLIGGSAFEEPEENPMLGFRGASRYYDERYREGFALECVALKRVRETARVRQHHRDDPVLPDPAGSGPGAGRDGGERPGPGRERPAGLHDVRDPVQRCPRRKVRHPLRRLFHRLQRPHPAGPGRGPGFGAAGLTLR